MIIIGAGMAGLLAAGMIRDSRTMILEAQKELPNNHSAVLRFRSTAVGDALGIEFKEVSMMKCYQPWRNPVADNLAYSQKCNGTATLRSIVTADASLHKRYIAPPDLIKQMSDRISANIYYGAPFDPHMHLGQSNIISTIPMPQLMKLLNYPLLDFKYCSALTLTATIPDCDAYVSVYVPAPTSPFSRVSLTGNKLIAEIPIQKDKPNDREKLSLFVNALHFLGMSFNGQPEDAPADLELKEQRYAKILPIDDNERKRFIIWATEKHNIYSLGRFATWRPGLLLDDVVNDIKVIRRIMKFGSYDQRKK
jgi:hypothetical protein